MYVMIMNGIMATYPTIKLPHGKLLETDLPFNRNDVIYVVALEVL